MPRATGVFPAIDWASHGDPWYRVGVWCVIYGGLVAAPTLTVGGLLFLVGALGLLPMEGEAVRLLVVGAVSGIVVAAGLLLIRRSRRERRRLYEVDDRYWL